MPLTNVSLKIFLCIFGIFTAVSFNVRFLFRASSFLNFESEKCPFCFDKILCDFMDDIEIDINIFDYIVGMLNPKFVFFGFFRNRRIVIKRLAEKQEKDKLDAEIDYIVKSSEFKSVQRGIGFYAKCLQLLNRTFFEPSYKLRICPTLENVDEFFSPIVLRSSEEQVYANIWTSLILNPEPLLLQIFRYEDGWHVPKYFGSCGRTALMEYCGKTLDHYIDHPWLFRIHIVEQLLAMAHSFTFVSSSYAVYFRDISYSNVVLDKDMKTRIIDLEHVIVVDKSTSRKNVPESWFSMHTSEDYDCDDCVAYSPINICNHHISDHNFYAVCKEFLHSIYPKDFGLMHSATDQKYHSSILEQLKYYVEECIRPSKMNTRFEIAKNFSSFLTELKEIGHFEESNFVNLI